MIMKKEKTHKIFIEGAISPSFIGDAILKHSSKKMIGAHSIFLGQVRNDITGNRAVVAIEYTTYGEMAEEKYHEIREETFSKFPLTCLHVYHSLGKVAAGEISLFVFTSAPHRKASIDACAELVERIKKELPVWGKEIINDGGYEWKENK